MATKWRAQQRRKRWTDRALSLPSSADHDLEALRSAEQAEVAAFGDSLMEFIQLPTTFAQLAAAKRLSDKLLALATCYDKEQVLGRGLQLYVELLFGENSRPLHKGLLTVFLHQFPGDKAEVLKAAFLQGCVEYGAGGVKERRFSLARLATSMANLPQKSILMRAVVEHCVRVIVPTLCQDVGAVLTHTKKGGRPTPKIMEECQDSMSALYYFLQNYSHCFRCPEELSSRSSSDIETVSCDTDNGIDERCKELDKVYLAAVETILSVLQSTALSRDSVVGAGVALCAAAQIRLSPQFLALMFANAAFPTEISRFALLSEEHGLLSQGKRGMLELAIHELRGSSLAKEIDQFTEFGKLCLFRGLLTGIARSALNANLLCIQNEATSETELAVTPIASPLGDRTWKIWTLLYDGILPTLCRLCEGSMDSHFKFHTVTAMQICLQQIKASILGRVTVLAAEGFSQAAVRHQLTIQDYEPLPPSMVGEVLRIVWNNWEDPLTQTVKQVQIVFDLLIDVQLVYLPLRADLSLDAKQARTTISSKGNDVGLVGQLAGNIIPLESDHELDVSANGVVEELGYTLQSRSDGEDSGASTGTQQFLINIAIDLLSVGGHRKGRYVPLASLGQRVGALKLLEISPSLLFETIFALGDDDVCCSASSFLKSFLERLREEHWTLEGVTEGSLAFRRLWVPPILAGLASGNPRLRSNLNIYALPVALEIDPDAVLPMLDLVLKNAEAESPQVTRSKVSEVDIHRTSYWQQDELGEVEALTMEQYVATLVSILKVARSLALIEGEILLNGTEVHQPAPLEAEDKESIGIMSPCSAVFRIRGQQICVPMVLLESAVSHLEDGVRVNVAELLCLSPKTASMPSPLELQLLRIAMPLNMRCSSTGFRMKWISLLKKFFLRVRTAVERQQKLDHDCSKRLVKAGKPMHHPVRTKASATELRILTVFDAEDMELSSGVTVESMQQFMQWLTQLVVSSLYPSAPYERRSMAMEILNAIIDVWSLSDTSAQRFGRYTSSPFLRNAFSPYTRALLSPETTSVVFTSVVDSWDRLREGAFKVLTQYPTPLPGLDTEHAVEVVLVWVKELVRSPRVRESDAGALALRLIFQKYVCELGWTVKLHPEPRVVNQEKAFAEKVSESVTRRVGEAIGKYIESLNDWLEFGIGEGDTNLVKACEQSFVHGVLLALRYTMEELDFSSTAVQTSSLTIRNALHRLLGLLLRVTALALWVVSADALNIQERFALSPLDELISFDIGTNNRECVSHHEREDAEDTACTEGLAPVEQMVMVGCWLSMKEVSLVLGSIARRVPLPGSTFEESSMHQQYSAVENLLQMDNSSDGGIMLDTKQLESIGQHFLQVLLSMKHNGAIDKTRAGFTALCDRLLRSTDPRLNAMPEIWLKQLIEHTGAKGQTVDDLLRRSAGIPAAFLALFLSEPDGAPKKLLPAAMRWIITTANNFLSKPSECREADTAQENGGSIGYGAEVEEKFSQRNQSMTSEEILMSSEEIPKALKERNEGVVPAVHCFNVMRVAFHDTNLATDTSGFCAEGLVTAIQAFSSRHWEVRNSATLAFTALVHRTIGFLNVYKRESARRAITGFEFFHRYPVLHPFLLQELQFATWQLENGPTSAENGGRLASKLHPSLGPVLLILSRLKPSLISSNAEDWLSPAAFMPYIMRCATQCNQQVRVLASRALAPLVGTEHLLEVLEGLAESLPQMPKSQSQGISGSSFANGPFSFNAVHGVLLQVYVLLISNCLGLPDLEQRSKVINKVAIAIEKRLWLGSVTLCGCYLVVRGFLQMLDGLLEVERSCHKAAGRQSLLFNRLDASLLQLCAECLSYDKTEHKGFVDSCRVILREGAARMYFTSGLSRWSPMKQCVDGYLGDTGLVGVGEARATYLQQLPQPTFSMFTANLRRALCDNMYEVRFATLKVLKNFFKTVLVDCKSAEKRLQVCESYTRLLQPLLKERLDVESHPGCTRLILGVFYCWSEVSVYRGVSWEPVETRVSCELLANSVWGQGLSALTLLGRLLVVYEGSRQAKTKEVVLRCLGGCIRQIVLHRRRFNDLHLSTNTTCSHLGNPAAGNGKWEELCAAKQHPDASSPLSSKSIRTTFDVFVGLLAKHSDASEGVKFRRATADAIVASRLLEEVQWVGLSLQSLWSHNSATEDLEWYAKGILDVWSIAVKLLEDEDQELRHKLSQSIIQIVASSESPKGPRKCRSYATPAQVERVVQLSFDFLSAHFGSWTAYWDYLSDFILRAVNTGDGVDLVRRLFDKELDNHHEEELCFVQLSCLHLNRMLHKCGADIEEFQSAPPKSFLQCQMGNEESTAAGSLLSGQKPSTMSNTLCICPSSRGLQCVESASAAAQAAKLWADNWRRRLLMQAHHHVKASMQLQGSMHWLGGVTNHQDAFKPLYRSLLGLLTVAGPSIGQEEQVLTGLLELTDLLKQLPLNPLISNTHFALLATCQRHLKAGLGVPEFRTFMGSAFMEGFEPLFLL